MKKYKFKKIWINIFDTIGGSLLLIIFLNLSIKYNLIVYTIKNNVLNIDFTKIIIFIIFYELLKYFFKKIIKLLNEYFY